MEQAIAHKLPAFLSTIHSNTALVFGLLDTFYDEQASLREVRQILQRLLGSFQEMKSKGVSLLLVCFRKDRCTEGTQSVIQHTQKRCGPCVQTRYQ